MLHIDGSMGEGGGQILRSALALSIQTGTPFVLDNIRAGRKKPGLLRQYLTAVLAAAKISGAEVQGAQLRSTRLSFAPGPLRRGSYHFSIGSAGSTILVLQALLPAFFPARKEAEAAGQQATGHPPSGDTHLILEGGTHNPFAPPFGFLEHTYIPLLRRMGFDLEAQLIQPGFYPAGGGRIEVWLRPSAPLKPLHLQDRGSLRQFHARILTAHLPGSVAEREAKVLQKRLALPAKSIEILDLPQSQGPGNLIEIHADFENIQETFSSVGQKNLRAESVAHRAASQLRNYLATQAPIGPHLADQCLLPFALAGSGSFRTLPLTPHCRTNLEVIKLFTGLTFTEEEIRPGLVELGVGG